jgi:hypothetical protein
MAFFLLGHYSQYFPHQPIHQTQATKGLSSGYFAAFSVGYQRVWLGLPAITVDLYLPGIKCGGLKMPTE